MSDDERRATSSETIRRQLLTRNIHFEPLIPNSTAETCFSLGRTSAGPRLVISALSGRGPLRPPTRVPLSHPSQPALRSAEQLLLGMFVVAPNYNATDY